MFKRLEAKKSFYRVKKWEADRDQHVRRLKYMCEFPYLLGQSKSKSTYARAETSTPVKDSTPLICRKNLSIGGKELIVEVRKSAEKVFIDYSVFGKPESATLELTMQEVGELVGDKHEKLVDLVDIKDGEVILVSDNKSS